MPQRRPKAPRCGWCGAQLTPRHLRRYQYEPFVAYLRHSPELADLHTKAATLSPDPRTAKWDLPQRLLILRYLMWRDDERCGLCAMALPVELARIEHVVPLRFGHFDHQHGTAVAGSGYESRLHHVDNLQAVHDRCDQAKDNSSRITDWRHPEMWPLPTATSLSTPDTYLWVPNNRPQPSTLPPPAPPGEHAQHDLASTKLRRAQMVLYTISGVIAFLGLTVGWQNGTGGVIGPLVIAGLFFAWARRAEPNMSTVSGPRFRKH